MRELSPILLTSPTIRSGSTLLQRLLCSSSNALVYGEEIGKDLAMQLQILVSRQAIYGHSRQRFTSSLERVMQGDSNDWIVDLMPDIDVYLEALRQGAFAGLASCRQQAALAGRGLWGFKYPGWPPPLMRLLLDNLPATRVIYVVRNLADTARSAKAWGAFNDETDLQAFCAQWLEQVNFMQALRPDPRVLVLPFETLLREPGPCIDRLCAFLPFQDIDRGVLGQRINNLTEGVDPRRGHNRYIEPAALTAQEQAWVDAAATAATFE